MQTLLVVGGLVGGFFSVFNYSPAIATIFSLFILSAVPMYSLLVFGLDSARWWVIPYLTLSFLMPYSFAGIVGVVVIRALTGTGTTGYVALMTVYLALGTFLTIIFNYRKGMWSRRRSVVNPAT